MTSSVVEQLVVHLKVYEPRLGLKNVELGLVVSEKISPPPAGPLTIDHTPVLAVDAPNSTYSPPQEAIWSEPAMLDKQELASMATLMAPLMGK